MKTRSKKIFLWSTLGLFIFMILSVIGLYIISEQAIRPSFYVHSTPSEGLPLIEKGSSYDLLYQGFHHDPETDFGMAYENVEFPTIDGSILRGWLVPSEQTTSVGVVTIHGAWCDRRDFMRRLPMLHDAGYAVLLFDCREHGISDGDRRGPSFGAREHEDVLAAVNFMKQQRGMRKICLFGESQGGASAILAAAKDPDISLVIAENPYASFTSPEVSPPGMELLPQWLAKAFVSKIHRKLGVDELIYPLDVIDEIAPRPILFMHGTGDKLVSHRHSELLFSMAGEPKELWIASDAEHDALINLYPKEYTRRVMAFLDKYLPAKLP